MQMIFFHGCSNIEGCMLQGGKGNSVLSSLLYLLFPKFLQLYLKHNFGTQGYLIHLLLFFEFFPKISSCLILIIVKINVVVNFFSLAKAHKLPFKTKHQRVSTHFESIYIDLQMTLIVANTKARFFLLIINDFSLYQWIYFLHANNNVQSIFQSFITMVERHLSTKIKNVKTDGGVDFFFFALLCLLLVLCIKKTSPHTLLQNGVIAYRYSVCTHVTI